MALARREFWVAAGDPKAVLLFTAFIPRFVDPHDGMTGQILALGAACVVIGMVTASLHAAAGSRLERRAVEPRGARSISRTTGGMMPGAAACLATKACER